MSSASWSVMDVAGLVKALEEKWGVSAAPVAVAGAGGAVRRGRGVEEKTEFTVELTTLATRRST